MTPHLVHSGSEDKLVVTYDLKANRPMGQHTTQHSSVTGLSQRKDLEHEVVTSTLDGKLLFWDADHADATDGCDSPAGQPPEQKRDGRLAVRARSHDHPAASCVEGGA